MASRLIIVKMRLLLLLLPLGLFAENELLLECEGVYTSKEINQERTRVYGDINLDIQSNLKLEKNQSKESLKIRFNLKTLSGYASYPDIMLPPINGSKNGRLKIKKIEVSDDEYSLKYNLNFLNSVKTVIDRKSGEITSSSTLGDSFRGTCKKAEIAKKNKF